MQRAHSWLGWALLTSSISACSSDSGDGGTTVGGGGNGAAGSSSGGTSGNGGNGTTGGFGGTFDFGDAGAECPPVTCAALGWECGYTVDLCGNVVDCAAEGLTCGAGQVCVGGIDGPTECTAGTDPSCALCNEVPDCSTAAQPTRLTGRVITPGRSDSDTPNQVGVPNAIVYIMRTDQISDLPPIPVGVPSDGQSCDRCEDQDLGPLLAGAITDANGAFTIEGNVPVGAEFLLVVKAGKFRRVVNVTVPEEMGCQTTALPTTQTRLARDRADSPVGSVNIPKIAISTGRIDAMECVFEKMGIAEAEFGNFGGEASVHLYRGSGQAAGSREGATIAGGSPPDSDLYGSLERIESYDMIVSDCEGQGWDGKDTNNLFPERIANGAKVSEYVNRGGRLFASHLSFTWLYENGNASYDPADPIATGLNAASAWDLNYTSAGNLQDEGNGVVSIVSGRDQASPRIDNFASWLVNENVVTAPAYNFQITDPRSLATVIGPSSEEFVFRSDTPISSSDPVDPNTRVQQFSFNTPYGAPDEAACGRVAYSGFHVAATGGGSNPFATAVFPAHCRVDNVATADVNESNLTNQEKVLLYMLFDLGACVGDTPLPPPCVPTTCDANGVQRCGFTPDGCGEVLNCGPCRPPA
jgi:hypothetical protein